MPSGRRCRFGDVQVAEYDARLDGSKVPMTGPAIGLNKLLRVSLRRVDSFEERPRHGVHLIPAQARRNTLRSLHRLESIELNEQESSEITLHRILQEYALRQSGDACSPTKNAVLDPGLCVIVVAGLAVACHYWFVRSWGV